MVDKGLTFRELLQKIVDTEWSLPLLGACVPLVILIYFVVTRLRQQTIVSPTEPESPPHEQIITSIFDYSSLRESIEEADVHTTLDICKKGLPSLYHLDELAGLVSSNKTVEVPIPGVIRTKYTFVSKIEREDRKPVTPENPGSYYVFSFSAEKHKHSNDADLVSMRLVIKAKCDVDADQFAKNALIHYARQLLPGREEEYYYKLFALEAPSKKPEASAGPTKAEEVQQQAAR